jgi:hypothetical protein
MANSVRWTAQLDNVREVTLHGSADLDFWQTRLAEEGLTPLNHQGRASIAIVSAAGKFAGIPFRELSVSVAVEAPKAPEATGAPEATKTPEATGLPAYFLVRAFNSNRFFAFCERVFFSTPYDHATVRVEHGATAQICVTRQGPPLFRASMPTPEPSTTSRPVEQRDAPWMAQILLPSRGRPAGGHSKLFFARIGGSAQVTAFKPSEDQLEIHQQAEGDVFAALLKSNFQALEWTLRPHATHAKSKTYRRDELAALELGGISRQ